jgi:microcystin-dependent protein
MANSPNIVERGNDGISFEKPIPASQPGDTFPAGAILLWGAAAPPAGWMICDGTAISRAGFPTLFANYGTTWGAGDGTTTFNLPDYRDKIPVGKSGTKALASTGGAETVALTTAQLPVHNHGGVTGAETALHAHSWDEGLNIWVIGTGTAFDTGLKWGTAGATVYASHSSGSTGTESANHAHVISNDGSGSAHSNMQPYAAINYIIRAY